MPDQDSYPLHGEIIDSSTRDEQAAAALVTAGAFVSIADRHVATAERDEVVGYILRRRLAPNIAEARLATMFAQQGVRLGEPDFANVVIEALRPIAGLSLAPEVIAIAERVAAADEDVHPYELQAITLLRLITSALPRARLVRPVGARRKVLGEL